MESPTSLTRPALHLAAALFTLTAGVAAVAAQGEAGETASDPQVILEVQGLHYDAGHAVQVRVTARNDGDSQTANPLANPIASGFRLTGAEGKTWQAEKVGSASTASQPGKLDAHSYFGQIIDLAGHFPVLSEVGEYELSYSTDGEATESVTLFILPSFNETSSYKAVIKTAKGDLTLQLYREDAPVTVRNFVDLARQGFYDGLDFHYVRSGDIIMGGAPFASGSGGSGFSIPPEFNSRQHLAGTMAMVRGADPGSASSQFYICLTPQPERDGRFAVFAQVIEGMDTLNELSKTPTTETNQRPFYQPLDPLIIDSISIVETPAEPAAGS